MGNHYFKNNEIKKAIKEFKRAMKINPSFALAYNNLGEVYAFLEMYKEAIHEYERALEINPELSEAHFNMVISYILLKNYDLAWKHIDILNKLGVDTKILIHLLAGETRKPIL
jgi:tetratricopeptide (TPR) repeat protein